VEIGLLTKGIDLDKIVFLDKLDKKEAPVATWEVGASAAAALNGSWRQCLA